ncbi:alpha/beta-hydrolase [Patellaria atrata CBS 101060]|uniref:Alpha/beta-hydrolase n=1 Tax=Patellaria atrata CBS 101060 TaxID=1346257 RepID=A0A9P4VMT1_9PEZI|nr:alpha/beta-hydrolase [Patellaria atrata CBS 101060]
MPRIPFIGRLHLREYIALLGSFILIGLESLIYIITLALPGPIIRFCYQSSRKAFNYLSSPQGRRSRNRKKALVTSIAQASDFVELCALFGYYAEEHIVQTKDGYLLGLHRLGWKRGEEDRRVNSGRDGLRKKVVYMHHGLMMNSEVWVCLTDKERCLPFELVERGYDVWFGNNRGNKYSKKNVKHAPTSNKFWNFSMDQFAFHDIPNSIDYILSTTNQPTLSYIGFSQGTAQAFATLSIHPTLNDKVNAFIALAPAMSPHGLTTGIVDSMVKASPDALFLAFGRRAILPSTTMWQAILYPPIFIRFIDMSLAFLFGWTAKNISPHQKLAAYPHLYSFTSVKSVVHWFQIIKNGKFQMYDDETHAPFSLSNGAQYYKVAKFPTRNIKTPIMLVYGGSDSLVDIKVMLKELPKHTIAREIPHYEHLDFLWAHDVADLVFPHVFSALDQYADAQNNEGAYPGFRPFSPTLDRKYSISNTDVEADSPDVSSKKVSENILHSNATAPMDPEDVENGKPDFASVVKGDTATSGTSNASGIKSMRMPEGWWSSDADELDAETETRTDMSSFPASEDPFVEKQPLSDVRARSSSRKPSFESVKSVASDAKVELNGIKVMTGKPVGGVVNKEQAGRDFGDKKKRGKKKTEG